MAAEGSDSSSETLDTHLVAAIRLRLLTCCCCCIHSPASELSFGCRHSLGCPGCRKLPQAAMRPPGQHTAMLQSSSAPCKP